MSARPPLSARLVLHMLSSVRIGTLHLTTPDGEVKTFGAPSGEHLTAEIRLFRWRALERALRRGDIGFGESYIDAEWSSPNLAALLTLLAANRESLEAAIIGSRWALKLDRLLHLLRRNTLKQARKNIRAHYDLGNEFYRLWLDPTMTYSSALFEESELVPEALGRLEEAQKRKMRRALDALGPLTHDSLTLEIGCGWGGFAVERLQRPGRHVGVTLSAEQKGWADHLLSSCGLGDRAEIRLQDYREVGGQFDGIVSVEMLEAVGEAYWPTYFNKIFECLRPGARAVIQVIVIRDALFPAYRRGHDFIQKYIFPGGMLPSPIGLRAVARGAGLDLIDEFSFGLHYAKTLAAWLVRFNAQEQAIRSLGFDDRFLAMWRFYLAYCQAGFSCEDLNVIQVTLARPEGRA